MAAKRELKPRSNTVVRPHPFAADLLGPKDYKERPLECLTCPFPRWNAIHLKPEEPASELAPNPISAIDDRIIGEGG